MIAAAASLLTSVGLALGFACEPPPPPDPWLILTAPRSETDVLCPAELSRHDCVVRRWEAYREQIVSVEPSIAVARELGAIGVCAPGNIDGGPWPRVARALSRRDWETWDALINPCTCPRGALLDLVALWAPDAFDQGKPLAWNLLKEALMLVPGIETTRAARGCGKAPIASTPAIASRVRTARDMQP